MGNENYVEMVKHGYSEANGCLQFLVNFHKYNFNLLRKAVTQALPDGYNEFSAKRFVTAFNKIEPLLVRVQFGRDYSPVVFITLRYDASEDTVNAVRKAFKPTKFDEFSIAVDPEYD